MVLLINTKKKRAAWGSLTATWDSARWKKYFRSGRGPTLTATERGVFRGLLRPSKVKEQRPSPRERLEEIETHIPYIPVDSGDDIVSRPAAVPIHRPVPEMVNDTRDPADAVEGGGGMILDSANSGSGGTETTGGSVLDDMIGSMKRKGKTRVTEGVGNWFDNAVGSIFGDDEDDRPAWQRYGWSGEGNFASQVSEGNAVTDRARRVLLTGYVDANQTKAWVGKRLMNRRTGRKTNKRGDARELYDARMEAIRAGIIQESAITDPTFEYGKFRDIGARDIPASSGENKPTTGIGDNLVIPEDEDLVDQFRGMFEELYRKGADDGSAGGGMADTTTVGAGVQQTSELPVGLTTSGIVLAAVALVGLVLLARG